MKTKFLFLFICNLWVTAALAQFSVPSCPSNIVYLHNSPIQAYNPALPIGAGNPVSTGIPSGGTGLALMPNLNAPTPNPTFYTTMGGNIAWWNGSSWVNTGHSTGNSAAVNLGGGGCYLYNLVGSTGQVYVYNGTGPATLLVTLSGFSGGGPYDICCDANGNWYILKTTTPQSMTMYSPAGAVLATYNMTGMPSTSAGGGFAIIGGTVYVSNSSGFFTGPITGTTIAFTNNSSASGSMSAGDYASCPINSSVSSFTSNAVVSGTLGCSTTSVTLTANTNISPVNSYSWSGPGLVGATNGSVATANAPGTYSCTITKTVCPSTSTIVTVNVTSNGTIINPVIAVSNTITCANPTTQLSATPGPPGYTYAWTGLGIVGANNTDVITANLAGTYTVAVANTTNACQGTQTVAVVTNTTPPIVTSSPTSTSICFGQSTNLTAGGALSYTWSTSSNATSISVSPTSNSTYFVVGTAANGCTNSAVSSVTVIPLPTPLANNDGPKCVGATLNLNATGGTTYFWAGPNSFFNATQSPSIPNVSLLASGIYTVVASVGSCTGVTTTSVTINPLPSPTIQTNSPICEGQILTLTGTGGNLYSWSGPPNFSSASSSAIIPVSAPSNSGTFTLTVTDGNGCVNSTTAGVTINPLPIPAAFGSSVCTNQNLNLNAGGGATYSWSGPMGFSSSLQNPVITNANTSMSGVYTVTVTSINNCVSIASAIALVNPLPVPSASNNGPICHNQMLLLSGTGGLNYTWVGPNGYFSTAQNPSVTTAPSSMSGGYTLTVTDAIGCSGTISTPVQINPLPNATIASSLNRGCAPLCVTFTALGSPGLQNTWSFGTGQSNTGLTTQNCYGTDGVYTVTANYTDANGCSNTSSYTVEAYPVPVADFNWAPIKPIINNDKVDFTDASYNGNLVSWNWYFTNTAANTSNIQNPSFYYEEPGSYPAILVVKTDQGCTDTIVKVIVVGEDFGIYVPNAFSPNGDGLNDVFQPKGFGIVKYELQIFDRWGERIFRTTEFEQAWDGIRAKKSDINYTIAKEDVYAWKINVTDVFGKHHEYTGHVTLIK